MNTLRLQRSLIPNAPKGMKQGLFLVFVRGKDYRTIRAKCAVLARTISGLRKDHPTWLCEAQGRPGRAVL